MSIRMLVLTIPCLFLAGQVGQLHAQNNFRRSDSVMSLIGWGRGCNSCGNCDKCAKGCATGGCKSRRSCDGCDGCDAASDSMRGMMDDGVPPGQEDVMGGGDLLAGSYGATAGSRSATPGMIGDFFGNTYRMILPSVNFVSPPGTVPATNVPIAAGDRRFKISENNSPFPQDRVFFNYHHFNNSISDVNGRVTSLDRYLIGIEKTFLGGYWSVEGRVPFASGLRAQQVSGAGDANDATEFGNMSLVVKRLLFDGYDWRFSAGLGVVFPTGPKAEVFGGGLGAGQSIPLLTIANDAVYLQPFLGAQYSPNDRLFVQMFAQMDFDTSGNEVSFAGFNGIGGGSSGVIQDQSLLFLDVAVGYWLFRDPYRGGCLTGLSPIVELHYSTTMDDTDIVGNGFGDLITNPENRLDVLNLTAGLRAELWGRSYLTVAAVAPLRERPEEKLFDSEVSVQYIRTF